MDLQNTLYSKINTNEDDQILILNIPEYLKDLFNGENIDLRNKYKKYDFIIYFVNNNLIEINDMVAINKQYLDTKGTFFIMYPKEDSPMFKNKKNDCNKDSIWKELAMINWRPTTIHSFNEDWNLMQVKEI